MSREWRLVSRLKRAPRFETDPDPDRECPICGAPATSYRCLGDAGHDLVDGGDAAASPGGSTGPARWLDRDLDGLQDYHSLVDVGDFIDGLTRPEQAVDWLAVEMALDRGPRERVVRRLGERWLDLRGQAAAIGDAVALEQLRDDELARDEPRRPVLGALHVLVIAAAAEPRDDPSAPAADAESAPDPATADGGDPPCDQCGEPLEHDVVAGEDAWWCHECGDFRRPA